MSLGPDHLATARVGMSLNKTKRLRWIVILILSLSLVACLGGTEVPSPEPEQSEATGNPTYIETVEVEERDGDYYAIVKGSYPEACSKTGDIEQEVEGDTIHLTIYSTRPEGMMCAQALTPFTEEILLDTEGLAPGDYTVIVNEDDATTTFSLS
jgi:hypothetical protein